MWKKEGKALWLFFPSFLPHRHMGLTEMRLPLVESIQPLPINILPITLCCNATAFQQVTILSWIDNGCLHIVTGELKLRRDESSDVNLRENQWSSRRRKFPVVINSRDSWWECVRCFPGGRYWLMQFPCPRKVILLAVPWAQVHSEKLMKPSIRVERDWIYESCNEIESPRSSLSVGTWNAIWWRRWRNLTAHGFFTCTPWPVWHTHLSLHPIPGERQPTRLPAFHEWDLNRSSGI